MEQGLNGEAPLVSVYTVGRIDATPPGTGLAIVFR